MHGTVEGRLLMVESSRTQWFQNIAQVGGLTTCDGVAIRVRRPTGTVRIEFAQFARAVIWMDGSMEVSLENSVTV